MFATLRRCRARCDGSSVIGHRTKRRHDCDDSEFLRHDAPHILAGDYLPLFGLDRCTEELEAASDLFEAFAIPSTLSRSVTAVHRQALARFGPMDGELMAVALLEELAGARLRSTAVDASRSSG